jgi:hypothetical protein
VLWYLYEFRFRSNEIFRGHDPEFANAIFVAVADATQSFASHDPENAANYKLSGFNAFWRMLMD